MAINQTNRASIDGGEAGANREPARADFVSLEALRMAGLRARLTPGRLVLTLAVLLAVLLIAAAFAIAIGSEHISLSALVKILISETTGRAFDVVPEQKTIIWDIRFPRVLMGIIVGAGLSVAGTAYQALLRNPLADPYILGVSTGAAVGALSATVFAESIPVSRPVAAFIGAVLTIAIVYILGQSRQGGSSERLILAGVITNAFLSSVVIFLVTAVADSRLRSVFSWLIGDLSGEPGLLAVVAGLILAGIVIIYLNARSLNLLMVGEQEALALGVEVRRVKIVVYVAASLITGAAVAVSGVIGFVGLIIPHAVRLVGGSDNRLVVPASALVGGSFLLFADTVARTVIAPRELHIGVITALIGAPIFVYLLRRTS
ncbi:MAG TPA: iron ABC transporter permease [Blastocatellia bacterium]|nr:iron ABC transporter permease [Blastocatellia bacterium]